ncbi:MAG TPA: hypothetical protein VF231_04980, partial [Candidatus Limnocylindrales bacterium]
RPTRKAATAATPAGDAGATNGTGTDEAVPAETPDEPVTAPAAAAAPKRTTKKAAAVVADGTADGQMPAEATPAGPATRRPTRKAATPVAEPDEASSPADGQPVAVEAGAAAPRKPRKKATADEPEGSS